MNSLITVTPPASLIENPLARRSAATPDAAPPAGRGAPCRSCGGPQRAGALERPVRTGLPPGVGMTSSPSGPPANVARSRWNACQVGIGVTRTRWGGIDPAHEPALRGQPAVTGSYASLPGRKLPRNRGRLTGVIAGAPLPCLAPKLVPRWGPDPGGKRGCPGSQPRGSWERAGVPSPPVDSSADLCSTPPAAGGMSDDGGGGEIQPPDLSVLKLLQPGVVH